MHARIVASPWRKHAHAVDNPHLPARHRTQPDAMVEHLLPRPRKVAPRPTAQLHLPPAIDPAAAEIEA